MKENPNKVYIVGYIRNEGYLNMMSKGTPENKDCLQMQTA
jgi:hypothetical protein